MDLAYVDPFPAGGSLHADAVESVAIESSRAAASGIVRLALGTCEASMDLTQRTPLVCDEAT